MRLLPLSADVRGERGVRRSPSTIEPVNRADRVANLALLALAVATWAAVAIFFTTEDPRGNASAVVAGALLLGGAIALTLAPLLWLATFARHKRIAYRGDWSRAVRRAALVGLVVLLLVLLRGQGALSAPLTIFVITMAVLVEVTLSLRRA